jgi:hypothetical protein
MSGRNSPAYLASTLLVIISTAALAGTVADDRCELSAGTDSTFNTLHASSDPMAWAKWDELAATNELPPAMPQTPEPRTKSLEKDEPTPVAPVPPALISGGSVFLGAAILKLIRKIKRG